MIQPRAPRKSWFPSSPGPVSAQGVRPWHPVDPAVKSMLGKTDRKLKETGARQQLTLDRQLRRWVFRIGGPLRLEHGAGNSGGTPGRKPRGSRFHSR